MTNHHIPLTLFQHTDSRPYRLLHVLVFFLLLCASSAQAAKILWVSDSPPNLGFSGPLSGLTDQGFIKLLQNAGHTVDRFDNPEANTTLLSQTEINTINSYDLVFLGRACASAQFQTGQGDQWNTNIIKPLICMSPYFVRPDGGRLAWFSGTGMGDPPDDLPAPVTAANTTDPAVDFLLGGVEMAGLTTAENYDELLDRNTSHPVMPIEPSGRILLNMTFVRENNAVVATAAVVADFQAGALVRGGASTLAGYRMWLSGGTRESATAPHNNIPLYTGRETLTSTGEDIFIRAVQLALNQGVPPAGNPSAPPVVTRDPVNVTVTEGGTVSFSVASAGAAPRTVQWQRDSGSGFVDIAGASTAFSNSRLTLTNVSTADSSAKFRAVVTNGNGTDTSDVATLTVNDDAAAPVPLTVGSVDGAKILVCFDELVDNRTDDEGGTANDEFNYAINGVESPSAAVLQPDGKSVLLTLNTPVSGPFSVTISLVEDRSENVMPAPVTLNGSLLGLTAAAVGAVNPAGSVVACSTDVFQVTGGGLDLGLTATAFTDTFQFAYKSVDGDFDARVRVQSIVGLGRLECVSKAILTARNSTDPGSPAVNVFVTPQAPADDLIASSARPAVGANTNNLGAFTPNGLPGNAWMRITREGNLFTTYRSTDGNTWNQLGNTSVALPSTMLVGVGAASHRNGFSVVATFSNFQAAKPINQPTLGNPALNGSTFTASFTSQAGITYLVQYKNFLDDAAWQLLETINGDGSVKTITDSNATVPNRFYRITAQ